MSRIPNIKLYGYATSPFVRKTACFLYYKQLPFEHVPVNPIEPEKTIGFTGGNQVPVLEIDGEWRIESSDHAHWLDEIFPDYPLCPAEYRSEILAIDEWLTNTFLLALFRPAIDGKLTLSARTRYWRLASLVSSQTPLPAHIQHRWPDLVRGAPFVQAMGKRIDLTESYSAMTRRIGLELVRHIGNGPFIGGIPHPTMLDLAVFPQLIFGVMAGLQNRLEAAQHPVLKRWIGAMAKHLPNNPILINDNMIVKSLEEAMSEIRIPFWKFLLLHTIR